MSEEEAFLAAIRAAPADDTVRLVYADWLIERNDARGDLLFVDCSFRAVLNTGRFDLPLWERYSGMTKALDKEHRWWWSDLEDARGTSPSTGRLLWQSLVATFGPVCSSGCLTGAELRHAVAEGRGFATVYPKRLGLCEDLFNPSGSVLGPTAEGVERECKCVFAKPLPAGLHIEIGYYENFDGLHEVCTPARLAELRVEEERRRAAEEVERARPINRLYRAIEAGDLTEVSRAIADGADVNDRPDRSAPRGRHGPLHCALGQGHIDIVCLLFHSGATVSQQFASNVWLGLVCHRRFALAELLDGRDPPILLHETERLDVVRWKVGFLLDGGAGDHRFSRDASGRFTFDFPGTVEHDFESMCKHVAAAFGLVPAAKSVISIDRAFWDFKRGESVVGFDWDGLAGGVFVTAKNASSEQLVRYIAAWLLSSRWATTAAE